jgi:hypothetical protein
MRPRITWLGAGFLLIFFTGLLDFLAVGGFDGRSLAQTKLSYEELTGSRFLPAPSEPFQSPRVRELSLPRFEDATSIWGATGRDVRGHIWVGVSANSNGMSARLFEYDPNADLWHDRGAVLDQLKAASLYRKGEGQIKIHSKIVPGADGWLYFASTDEEGEQADVEALPRWGGHLWRIHPERHTWQHLLAVRDGLVAVSGAGQYVYALGYWGHVLYQYDQANRRTNRVVVGSFGGHVSRNFIADMRGHAYVPRLIAGPRGKPSAALVEYDASLNELAATPLKFYLDRMSLESNHGIIALAYLPGGRMLFATHAGYLYLIEPRDGDPAKVTAVGWVHPNGSAYTPSLFSLGGNHLIGGVARRRRNFEWVVFDLQSGRSKAFPLDTKGLKQVLLYGSVSRDNAGRAYVVGWAERESRRGQRPLVLQIDPGR